MAYFLDPELASLTSGGSSSRPESGQSTGSNRRPNQFGKRCHGCGTWVKAQKGYLGRDKGAWVVYCTKCP